MVFIIGAGDHARVVYDILHRIGTDKKIEGFIDILNKRENIGIKIGGSKVVGTLEDAPDIVQQGEYLVAHGEPKLRAETTQKLKTAKLTSAIIAKSAIVSETASVDAGTMIGDFVVVNSNAKIGKSVIVNTSAVVEHDVLISDYTNINPGVIIGGNSRIGKLCKIGMGAMIADEITIGDNTIIGAGSVVLENIPGNVVAYGVPCKIVKKNEK